MHVAAGHAELLGCVLISDFFTGGSVFWDEVEGDLGVSSFPFPRAAGRPAMWWISDSGLLPVVLVVDLEPMGEAWGAENVSLGLESV